MTFYADSPLTRRIGEQHLAQRLQQAIEGEVLFDAFSRGRYSTDASIYQVEPIGVVTPRSEDDIAAIVASIKTIRDPSATSLPLGQVTLNASCFTS